MDTCWLLRVRLAAARAEAAEGQRTKWLVPQPSRLHPGGVVDSVLWAGGCDCVGGLATHYVSFAFDNDHIRSPAQLVTNSN